ncbi:unnamed protein product [Calypogeia fissa]
MDRLYMDRLHMERLYMAWKDRFDQVQMAFKEKFVLMGFPDHKVMAGFCSTSIFCLLLFILLHLSSDSRGVVPCGDCKLGSILMSSSTLGVELAEEERVREVVTNLSTTYLSESEGNLTENPQQPEVKVIEEWRLPSVTEDRPHEKLDDVDTYGEPRRFMPMGSGAFLFIQFGAYRGGPKTFAVVGLGTKGLHLLGNPGFNCSWVSNGDNSTVEGTTKKYYPDWGLGRQYSVVVVNCTFDTEVGVDGSGGRLEVTANHGTWDHTGLPDVHFVALTEEANKYDGSIFSAPYKYDYLYCGSPLYGPISPQRIREWIAYHVRLFGPRSHFILYDAGGIHDDVRKVLEPWIKLGFVTLENIRQESRYDVYYYSQFLINNDCVFRGKTLANWTFFFDVDEYIYVPNYLTFDRVMLDYTWKGRRAQQVHFRQNFMNHNHCRNDSLEAGDRQRRWGFEKLVYRRTQRTREFGFTNRKYAIQAQYALTAGVHMSTDTTLPEGKDLRHTTIYEDSKMIYFHYHNTIDNRGELCEEFIDPSLEFTAIDNAAHVLDLGMAVLADAVRDFENRTIGPQPFLP